MSKITTKISKRVAKKEFDELVELEIKYAEISVKCANIAKERDLKTIAMQMGNFSIHKLRRLLRKGMAHEAKFEDLHKFLWACGYEMTSSIRKRKK